jgi:transposase-like protein
MTHQDESSIIEDVLKVLTLREPEGLKSAIKVLLNAAMKIEREEALQAAPYERSVERTGYGNGFKDKTISTRLGKIALKVPQVRGDLEFYPRSLEKGIRSERALKLAIAEMYVKGVSTRKVSDIVEQLCGTSISSAQVSAAASVLDEEIAAWRNRPLGRYQYLILDARYENVRVSGSVASCAVLVAIGIDYEGHRDVLGVSVSLSEAEVHWRKFLETLIQRGMHGLKLVTSDAHVGLRKALEACFPGAPWQRCQFHLQQNAMSYVPKISMRKEVGADIRSVLTAPDRVEADRLLRLRIEKYRQSAPQLAEWMEANVPQSLSVFAIPQAHRRLLRTTNMLERQNRELKKRTKIASIFPNEESLLRLVGAMLMETSEQWLGEKRYLPIETSE